MIPAGSTSNEEVWSPMKISVYLNIQQAQLARQAKEKKGQSGSVQSLASIANANKRRGSGSNAIRSKSNTPMITKSKSNLDEDISDLKESSARPDHVRSYSEIGEFVVPSNPVTPIINRSISDVPPLDSGADNADNTPQKEPPPFRANRSESVTSLGSNKGSKKRKNGSANTTYTNTDQHLLPSQLFALIPEHRVLLSCGHWDHSFRVTGADSGKLIQSVTQHSDVVTCLAWTQDYGKYWVVTGSRDCTLMVWELNMNDRESPVSAHPSFVLYGHNDAISTVAVIAELDVVLSGSADGTVIVHNLREGTYIRSILVDAFPLGGVSGLTRASSNGNMSDGSNFGGATGNNTTVLASCKHISWINVTAEGLIVIYCADENALFTYTINGKLLAYKDLGNDSETLSSLILSEDGSVLITGGSNCLVVFRWVRTLQLADNGPRKGMIYIVDGSSNLYQLSPFNSPIRSLCLTKRERHLIVGLESGEIRILAQDPEYLRHRLQQHLFDIGIL